MKMARYFELHSGKIISDSDLYLTYEIITGEKFPIEYQVEILDDMTTLKGIKEEIQNPSVELFIQKNNLELAIKLYMETHNCDYSSASLIINETFNTNQEITTNDVDESQNSMMMFLNKMQKNTQDDNSNDVIDNTIDDSKDDVVDDVQETFEEIINSEPIIDDSFETDDNIDSQQEDDDCEQEYNAFQEFLKSYESNPEEFMSDEEKHNKEMEEERKKIIEEREAYRQQQREIEKKARKEEREKKRLARRKKLAAQNDLLNAFEDIDEGTQDFIIEDVIDETSNGIDVAYDNNDVPTVDDIIINKDDKFEIHHDVSELPNENSVEDLSVKETTLDSSQEEDEILFHLGENITNILHNEEDN
jgi:hypothetical protein